MGKLDGKVAVITGATSGMALAGAKLFVDEGAHVFISGRRKDALDEAVKLIGRNVTGVQADSADLDDLDRLFETVKEEKGVVDVLWASAGAGEQGRRGELRERKIRVNVLTPGQVASPMLEEVMDAEMKAQFESLIPRREMGRPEEIASAALFLASDDSSYVN